MNLRVNVVLAFLLTASAVMAVEGAKTDEIRTGVFPFYPYAARYDMWSLTPMDQGGRLIQLQVIGSERDEDVVKAIRSPRFFAPWGDPIRWDSLEKTEIERSVWLNRWYFLPCFARHYYLTKDKAYLREALTFIRKWAAENPVPTDLAGYFATRRYNWRDMQVAWRMQNLAWVYFLGKDGFTAAEQRELFELVATHAHVLLEYFGKQALHENNHQSHGATAMLFAALLFPDLPEAAALKERAFVILNHHLDLAFYDDGNSIELTPGYYPFIVSVFRDAYLLCRPMMFRRRHAVKSGSGSFTISWAGVKPDGHMPPINDSPKSDPSATLRVLADQLGFQRLIPRPARTGFQPPTRRSCATASAATPAYAFLDAGPISPRPWHGGKLGFQLWCWDRRSSSTVASAITMTRETLLVRQAPSAQHGLVDGAGDYDPTKTSPAKRPLASSRIVKWESE